MTISMTMAMTKAIFQLIKMEETKPSANLNTLIITPSQNNA